jgi:hypothetical protein
MAFLNERNLVRELFLRGWIRAGWKRQRQGGRDATNKEKKGGGRPLSVLMSSINSFMDKAAGL